MKQIVRTFELILALSLVLTISAMAQSQSTTGGNQGRGQRGFYDPTTVTTISGTVVSVETAAGRNGGNENIRLTLSVDSQTIRVMIGPVTYLAEQKITISPKDTLKVKGSKMERNGNTMIISAEITKGDKTWTLRDDTGTPKWGHQAQTAPAAPQANQ